jgi:hypothetical protein
MKYLPENMEMKIRRGVKIDRSYRPEKTEEPERDVDMRC